MRMLLLPLLLLFFLTDICRLHSAEPETAVSDTDFLLLYEGLSPLLNRNILSRLEEPFLCDFKNPITLRDAFYHVIKRTNINTVPDSSALADIGVTLDKPVNFRLSFPIPLHDALTYLANQHGLVWEVSDGAVKFTSEKEKVRAMSTRVYYIGDFTGQFLPVTEDAEAAVGEVLSSGITDFIMVMVAPKSWEVNGGEGVMNFHFPTKSLAIRQTEDAHKQIEDLLHRVRQLKGQEGEPPAVPITPPIVSYYTPPPKLVMQVYDVAD